MKKISLYITEKLHIDKEVKTIKPDLSNVKAPFIYPESKACEEKYGEGPNIEESDVEEVET